MKKINQTFYQVKLHLSTLILLAPKSEFNQVSKLPKLRFNSRRRCSRGHNHYKIRVFLILK